MNSYKNSIEHKPAGQDLIRLPFRSTPLQRWEDRTLQYRSRNQSGLKSQAIFPFCAE